MSIDMKLSSIIIDFMNRVSTCDFLFQQHKRDPFLKRLVTGDEIWILY